MHTSKEKLIKIYEEAKHKRIVLTQAEFAKAVGKSRAHLFKKMEIIPEDILKKAQALLETDNVSKKTINVTDKPLNDFIGERVELMAAVRAAIKILTLKHIELEVKVSELAKDSPKQSFSDLSLEIERKMQDETEHILDEWRKK